MQEHFLTNTQCSVACDIVQIQLSKACDKFPPHFSPSPLFCFNYNTLRGQGTFPTPISALISALEKLFVNQLYELVSVLEALRSNQEQIPLYKNPELKSPIVLSELCYPP